MTKGHYRIWLGYLIRDNRTKRLILNSESRQLIERTPVCRDVYHLIQCKVLQGKWTCPIETVLNILVIYCRHCFWIIEGVHETFLLDDSRTRIVVMKTMNYKFYKFTIKFVIINVYITKRYINQPFDIYYKPP